jgi:hypothetical protein
MSSSENNVPSMELHKAINYILGNCELQLSRPEMAIPYMTGSPGIGKTQFAKKAAEQRGFKLVPFHFSLIPIEEIGGLPQFEQVENTNYTGTKWSLPDVMTEIYKAAAKNEKVVVMLDDYHMSSPAHLALGYEMFSERKLRNYVFPDNVAFIAAGNDSAKSGAKQMFGAIVNRFAMFKVEPDFDFWVNNYAIPTGVNPKIVTFLKSEVNKRFFLEEEDTYKPWASPRSWSRFSYMLNELEKYIADIPQTDIQYLGYAHLGGYASSEFTAYYQIYSKTEMDRIFDKKKSIIIPESNSDQYIYGMAAASEYINRIVETPKDKKQHIEIVGDIIIETAKRSVEIGVAIIKNISDYNKVLNKNMYIGDIFTNIRKDKVIESKMSNTLSNILESLS